MISISRLLAATAASALATGFATSASAQSSTAPSEPASRVATQNSITSPTPPAITDQTDIIVTATKRREAINTIAAPISAVTGEQLAAANANSLGDYIARLPGVVFNDYQPGISEVVIRGIAATTYHEQGQTTVGYYLNEVQIVEPGFPIGIPDIDTFDLDRVEVLRGPQGTLFGSSTLGGLVNYVARTADVTKFDLAASGIIGSTRNADGQLNYAGKAMVNVPVIKDKLAVRLMALQREDAGYLDNTGFSPTRKGSNDFRTRGLRGSVVFEPFDGTKITYLGTFQDTRLDDQTYVSFNRTYERVTQHLEPQRTSFWLNSLRLDQDLGSFATLTVLGSVDRKRNTTIFDNSFYGAITGNTTGDLSPYSVGRAHANIKTIEARLTSKDADAPFRWLIGSSYLHATKTSYDRILAPGAEAIVGATLAPGDRIYGYLSDSLNEDFGIFGEATWRPVRGLEITGGGRYYHTRAAGDVVNQASFLTGSAVDVSGSVNQKEHGFTPKGSIAVRPNGHTLAYFTYSRGYRVGGINPNAGLLPAIPVAYGSDTVDNYEAGLKTQLWGGRLNIDATVFDMVWKDIQARQFGPPPGFYSYVLNAANADVSGVELSTALRITRALTVSANVTYQDARLTSFLPDNYGPGYAAGTRLPGSSKWSVADNVSYERPDLPFKPTIAVAHRYLSKAPVAFGATFMRGGFDVFDARIGVSPFSRSSLGHLRLLGFVNNMFNKYGVLNGPFASQTFPAYSIIRPRSYGLRFDWTL